MDHVSVVVEDLEAARAFFTELGMTVEGEMPVEAPWVDRVNGLEGVRVDIVMIRTPDGHVSPKKRGSGLQFCNSHLGCDACEEWSCDKVC